MQNQVPKLEKSQLNFPVNPKFGIGTACIYAFVMNST